MLGRETAQVGANEPIGIAWLLAVVVRAPASAATGHNAIILGFGIDYLAGHVSSPLLA